MKKNRRQFSKPKETHPQASSTAIFNITHIPEPCLEFAYGQRLEYARDGLFLFGPVDAKKGFSTTRYGVIGTAEGVERLKRWGKTLAGYIPIPVPGPRSRPIEPQHVPFPGFKEAFHSEWPTEPCAVVSDISLTDISHALYISNRHEAVKKCVDLYVERLVREENRLEAPPHFWFVVIPELVYELGRPHSRVPRDQQIKGQVSISQQEALALKEQPMLFGHSGFLVG